MNLRKRLNFLGTIAFFLILVATGYVLLGGGTKKPQMKEMYRVGIISGADAFNDIAIGFKATMIKLGYFKGRNIVYDFQKANADQEAVERAVRKFVEDKVDLIFAFPTEPALAAKAAAKGTDIPVVFAMAGIEGTNLVGSLSKPGGNITGVRFPSLECTVKRLEILHELIPSIKKVYLIYDPHYPNASMALGGLRPAASSWGITLVEDPVDNIEELKAALRTRAELNDIGIDAILLMPDILDHSPGGFDAILKFANEHNLPIGGGMGFTADLGALFSFVPDNIEQGRMAANLADKIFKGTSAGSITIITPPPRLRLNKKAIQQFGAEIPEDLLGIADDVIR